MIENLQTQKESHDVKILKEKIDEVMGTLKVSELDLYALPWFILIGPTGSGKSSLLRQSGLHFSLSTKETSHTQNCDFWFADEAIFLDTAGRYISEENNQEEWRAFLKLLKKYRSRLPINGILIVLNLTDIIHLDEEALKKQVKLIRERMAELTHQLGYLFPVYIYFTQMDLLPGFSDFFKDDTGELLGIYLGHLESISSKIQLFKSQLKILFEKLSELVLKKLYLENGLLNQLNIISFPARFASYWQSLENFIELLFKESPYHETPNFMGVYFTSAIDQGYFIKSVFTHIIFADQQVIPKNKQKLLSLQWVKTTSIIISLSTILGAFFIFNASFSANTALLHQGVDLIQQNIENEAKLESLKSLTDYVFQLDNIPFYQRLGLYRGNDLLPYVNNYIKRLLNKYFLTPTATTLEAELMHYQEVWALNTDTQNQSMRGEYYTTLKSYLMLCEPEKMDADLAINILTQAWSRQSGLPPDMLKNMVYFYTLQPDNTAWTPKADIVELSRQQLYSKMDVNNLYAALRTKGLNQFKFLIISPFSSPKPLSLFFTKDNYENWMRSEIEKTAIEAMRGDWVMGDFQLNASSDQVNELKSKLTEAYFNDYIQNWLNYLQTIQMDIFEPHAIESVISIANENLDVDHLKYSMPLSQQSVQNYIKQLLSANKTQPQLYQASIMADAMVSPINNLEFKKAAENILLAPVRAAWCLILQSTEQALNTQWQTQVVSVYQQSLAHKFPFDPNGEDADINDITKFFATNGIFWQFVNQNLMAYLQQTPTGWQPKTWLERGINFSPQFLILLNQAKTISENFPQFEFEIYPEPTPGLREISLLTNGQTYHYRNDPQEWQKIHWPGNEPNDDTALSFVTANEEAEGNIEMNSLWGFFKLLKLASLAKDQDQSLRATWEIKAENGKRYRVSFLVKNDLFDVLLIDKFRVPNQLNA